MRRLLASTALALLALALWPVTAGASWSVTRVELVGKRILLPSSSPGRFTLAGVHWRGAGRVVFRTRSLDGRWSPWRPAAPEDEDAPDAGSRELRSIAGWRIGNPWWAGPSDRIEARTLGRVTRVRAVLVWSPEIRVPLRVPTETQQPVIVPRATWGANESIRRNTTTYAPSVRFAIVHHTAGRNTYSRSEAPAVVRGIQLYHVQGNGWNDIGYNFLVDRFGTIYEGRYGGIERNVVGAHAQGFNTGSVGIALLGTYGSAAPSKAAEDAIARLIAWRLDLAHVDPTGLLTVVSGGSERFAAGVPVPLRAVSGHRDTGSTQCPGDVLYGRLNTLAGAARRIGLPKIFAPLVEENDAGFRFTARLSSAASWSVVVATNGGGEVGRGTGTGSSVDWTWDPTVALEGTYTWTISAGSALPARGTIRTTGGATLAVVDAAAAPESITPNGDGQADSTVVAFRLTAPANVSVDVVDAAGAQVLNVVDRVWTRAGEHSALVDGESLADGRYEVWIIARRADGTEATATVPLVVSRTLGAVAVTPPAFSPNGDGRKDRVTLTFSLTAPADVRVRVLRDGRGVAGLLASPLSSGAHRLTWTGVRASGPIRDGSLSIAVDVQDTVGRVGYSVPVIVDTKAPRVRILSGRRLRIEVTEPSVLRIRIGDTTVRREVARAGVVRIPWTGPLGRVRVAAVDAAGNVSAPVVRPPA